jgi:hypothetical protein
MKQTAVEQVGIAFRQWQKEWENYNGTKGNKPVSYDEFIKPFLEMEKQQIGEAYEDGYSDSDNSFELNKEYYNKKFNK